MVKHIVCFKMKDTSESSLLKTKQMLLSMKGVVPQIIDIEVGIDSLHSSRSFDIALIVTVANFNELENYQNDPYHTNVVKKFIHEARADSVAVDYLMD